jgi:hypothetical protein
MSADCLDQILGLAAVILSIALNDRNMGDRILSAFELMTAASLTDQRSLMTGLVDGSMDIPRIQIYNGPRVEIEEA